VRSHIVRLPISLRFDEWLVCYPVILPSIANKRIFYATDRLPLGMHVAQLLRLSMLATIFWYSLFQQSWRQHLWSSDPVFDQYWWMQLLLTILLRLAWRRILCSPVRIPLSVRLQFVRSHCCCSGELHSNLHRHIHHSEFSLI
jgi:hypothetical protein